MIIQPFSLSMLRILADLTTMKIVFSIVDDSVTVPYNINYIEIPGIMSFKCKNVSRFINTNGTSLHCELSYNLDDITDLAMSNNDISIFMLNDEIPEMHRMFNNILTFNRDNVYTKNERISRKNYIVNGVNIAPKLSNNYERFLDIEVSNTNEVDILDLNIDFDLYDTVIIYNKNNKSVNNIPETFKLVLHSQSVSMIVNDGDNSIKFNYDSVKLKVNKDIIKLVREGV